MLDKNPNAYFCLHIHMYMYARSVSGWCTHMHTTHIHNINVPARLLALNMYLCMFATAKASCKWLNWPNTINNIAVKIVISKYLDFCFVPLRCSRLARFGSFSKRSFLRSSTFRFSPHSVGLPLARSQMHSCISLSVISAIYRLHFGRTKKKNGPALILFDWNESY